MAYIQPNPYQSCLLSEDFIYKSIMAAGGFKSVSCCASNDSGDPPWLTMPAQGRAINKIESLAMGSVVPLTDTLVLSYRVPNGYNFAITQLSNQFTGAGFTEGSGAIIWRLKINGRYVKNLGNIENTLGSAQQPWPLNRSAIIARSNSLVQYYVYVPSLFGAGENTVCGIYGWIYPMVPQSF